MFADIILPVSTKLEEEYIAVDAFSGQYHMIMREKKCIESLENLKVTISLYA